MALYHFHVTQVKRSKGQSMIAAAAYRAGEKLFSEYYDETADFTRKGGVVHSEILLPSHAPLRFSDRQTLWNEVERIEKHPKAQLAYNFDIALQNELSMEENLSLARQFVMENFISKGMIADLCIHAPDNNDNGIKNPHFHVLSPIRPLNDDGTWGDKQHRVYLKDEQENPILGKNGKPSFVSEPATDWGRPETLDIWRENWAKIVNNKFEEKGISAMIDHRSYKDMGLDLIPQIHEGPQVREMEKRGINTDKGSFNRWVKRTNKLIADIADSLKEIGSWLKEARETIKTLSSENKKQSAEKSKPPTVMMLINEWMDERNRVADTYSRGVQKAKSKNLAKASEIYAFLQERNIITPDDLDSYIAELDNWIDKKSGETFMPSQKYKDADMRIGYASKYEKNKEVAETYNSKFMGKKKYYAEHEKEIKAFNLAKRKLLEMYPASTLERLPELMKVWEREKKEAGDEISVIERAVAPYKNEVKKLKQIQSAMNEAMDLREGIEKGTTAKEKDDALKQSDQSNQSNQSSPAQAIPTIKEEHERTNIRERLGKNIAIVDEDKKRKSQSQQVGKKREEVR